MISDHLAVARRLTFILDSRFSVFGIRFGIDPILDIIPGLGNFVGVSLSLYLMFVATRLRVPKQMYLVMLWHILVDYILGSLPVVGIFADVWYKSNQKNIALLEGFAKPNSEAVVEGEIVEG